MYFAADLRQACCTVSRVSRQITIVESLFEKTLSLHPDWWCERLHAKDWRTYFIEFPYRNVELLNREWREDSDGAGRFKKRRELSWISAEELLSIYEARPERLWKRVRQLVQAPDQIRKILQTKEVAVS
jgi:hypothetical protein